MRSILILALCCVPQVARAQVVLDAAAGSSTLYSGTGGWLKTYINGSENEISLGGGILGGHSIIGVEAKTRWHDWDFAAGDQTEENGILTDLYSGSAFFVRGLAASRSDSTSTLRVFVGADAAESMFPYMFGTRAGSPLGLIFYRKTLSPKWTFSSFDVGASRSSSIQSVMFATRHVKLAASCGVGNNSPFVAGSATLTMSQLDAFVGYTASSPNFHRVFLTASTLSPENRGLDLQVDWHPKPRVHFDVTRQDFIAQNEEVTSFTLMGESLSAGYGLADVSATNYDSTSRVQSVSGQNFGGGIRLFDGFTTIHVMDFFSKGFKSTQLATVDQRVVREFHLIGNVSHQTNTDISLGASYRTNAVSIGVGYAEEYFPILAGESPWQRVLQASVSLNIKNAHGTVSTLAMPNTKIRYGVYGNDYLTSGGGEGSGYVASIDKYEISGTVVDVKGRPLRGAALRIGKKTVFTNDAGQFSVRLGSKKAQSLVVAFDSFLMAGDWKIVSAPTEVSPDVPFRIVLRRN